MKSNTAGYLFRLLVCGLIVTSVSAWAEFTPEKVGRIETIADGPHLYVSEWGKAHIINPETFEYQGMVSEATQRVVSLDGKTLYTTRTYYDRGREGAKHDTLRIWDVSTVTPTQEIPILNKVAMTGTQAPMMADSAQQKWLFILNATPAVSVTVFNVAASQGVAEVPIPGCWGIYPVVADENRFVSLCGDGRLSTLTIAEDGTYVGAKRSEQIFDVDQDPLFIHAERLGDTLYFVSFNGNLYTLDIAGEQARLVSKVALAPEGTPGNYKPSGYQLMSLIPGTQIIYILMQEEAWEGSHVEPANELWAYDLTEQKILSRSSVSDAISVEYYAGTTPSVYIGTKENGLVRYFADPQSNFTVRRDKFMKMGRVSAILVK